MSESEPANVIREMEWSRVSRGGARTCAGLFDPVGEGSVLVLSVGKLNSHEYTLHVHFQRNVGTADNPLHDLTRCALSFKARLESQK